MAVHDRSESEVPWVRVFAPATVGNVGPGFDVLGLALQGPQGFGDEVLVRPTGQPGVQIVSIEGDAQIPTDSTSNCASIAARAVLQAQAVGDVGLEMIIRKGLPVSSGLGGSAASACAGALAASELLGLELTKKQLVRAALEGEAAVAGRHVDNIAPCVYGGITLVHDSASLEIYQLHVPAELRIVIAIPPEQLDTRRARAAMPRAVNLKTAIAQWAHVGAMVSALYEEDLPRLRQVVVDGVAEPARLPLLEFGQRLKNAALDAGAYGSTLSGAGPTIFALADPGNADRVAEAMRAVFRHRKVSGVVHVCGVDTQGARRIGSSS